MEEAAAKTPPISKGDRKERADGLLTTRWLLRGEGQAVSDYGPEGRTYKHEPL